MELGEKRRPRRLAISDGELVTEQSERIKGRRKGKFEDVARYVFGRKPEILIYRRPKRSEHFLLSKGSLAC